LHYPEIKNPVKHHFRFFMQKIHALKTNVFPVF